MLESYWRSKEINCNLIKTTNSKKNNNNNITANNIKKVSFTKVSLIFRFNVIITKRNKTASAPTYTSTKKVGKNSSPTKKIIIEELQKQRTKNKIENIGFLESITKLAEVKTKLEKQ